MNLGRLGNLKAAPEGALVAVRVELKVRKAIGGCWRGGVVQIEVLDESKGLESTFCAVGDELWE